MSRKVVPLVLCVLALCGTPVASASHRQCTLLTRQPVGEPTAEQLALSERKTQEVVARLGWTVEGRDVQPMSDPEIPASKTLSTSGYIAQPDGTTCGPTSAHNLLLNWGQNVSISHLKTDLGWSTSGTPMSEDWPDTLNAHSGSSWYVIGWDPDQTTTWAAFVGDTLDDHPFILLVLMNDDRGYLVGYSDGEWGHYVTGNGYSNYYSGTKYGKYFDPYDGRAGTYGEHSVALSTWVSLLAENAIVW